jgi:hypothetical protein
LAPEAPIIISDSFSNNSTLKPFSASLIAVVVPNIPAHFKIYIDDYGNRSGGYGNFVQNQIPAGVHNENNDKNSDKKPVPRQDQPIKRTEESSRDEKKRRHGLNDRILP